ncbi:MULTISPECIES: phosphotransferase enzyme family protein [unclassified Pseudoclavibacter]|uniref:phosphotransferase enzyme family protein n=1 Tax=unclassified Pseudoclavibacter TaxID=2615177 RepID=UPI0015E42EBD|nr:MULTISPECIES: phosphotransferase [unclassified Pseudoclavibacter]MBF4550833.1 phosphotransferase [Pseudoclavibacter sp. VKM Ac-2888]
MIEATLKQPVSGLRVFDALVKGESAPAWLHDGMLAAFGLPPEAATKLISVSENASYLVELAGQPIGVVRLQQPGYQEGEGQLRSEMLWVEAIRDSGCAEVPSPIPGADGQVTQSIPSPDGMALKAVYFEHVRGSILQDVEDATPWFTELGQITARLHDHARSWRRPAGFDRFTWGLPDLLGSTARWGDWRRASLTPAQLDQLERAEMSALSLVQAAPAGWQDWGLVHSDLRPTNVIRDGERLIVIDFDDSGFSWFLYDFASALTFQEHKPEARVMARNWIDGYRSEGRLTDAQLELGCALSMVRTLTMLGWSTTHRDEALPPDLQGGGVIDAALFTADRFLASPTWLID